MGRDDSVEQHERQSNPTREHVDRATGGMNEAKPAHVPTSTGSSASELLAIYLSGPSPSLSAWAACASYPGDDLSRGGLCYKCHGK
jgi:hypothetical protein